MGDRGVLTARVSTALLLPLLASVVLLGQQPLLAAALLVATTVVTGLVAVRGVVAQLLAAVSPSRPRARLEPADTLPQNEPAAVGNPQPRAPGAQPLPC
ncbi:hypothetical protein [Kineococcus radiotolerans]|uniref:hypothetical protein n=1 Tax=Kineococcus radiotolerans TaxID=131568 RepID=UPI0012FF574A|nr:hypothetical protein [Kineococcus radiotolerans]